VEINPEDVFQTEDSRGKVITCGFVEAQDEWLPGKIVRNTFFRPERKPRGKRALASFRERLALCAQGPDDDGEDGDDDGSNRNPGAGPNPTPPGSGGNPNQPPSADSLSRLATVARVGPGIDAPITLALLAEGQVERGLVAACVVLRQRRPPRGYGTLTQTSIVPLQYQYSAQPTDRLRVVQLDGTRYEYFYQRVEGNMNVDAITFLTYSHSVALRAIVVGQSDLQIETTQGEGIRAARVVGRYQYGNAMLNGDIVENGTYVVDSDFDGFSRQDRSVYTGTVTGDNLAIQVSEIVEGDSMGGRRLYLWSTYGNIRRFIGSSWTTDGLTFSMHDAVLRSSYQNRGPAHTHNPAKWSAAGQLRVNGALAGLLNMTIEPSKILASIDLAEGSVQVQKWNR